MVGPRNELARRVGDVAQVTSQAQNVQQYPLGVAPDALADARHGLQHTGDLQTGAVGFYGSQGLREVKYLGGVHHHHGGEPAITPEVPVDISTQLDAPDLELDLDQMDYDRCPNTGTWLLETQQFQDFLESPSSSYFHLCGNPGSGKSFLTSKVIDDLRDRCTTESDTALIYFLCDAKTGASNRRTSQAVLSTWTAQLLDQLSSLDPVFVRKSVEAFGIVRKKTNHIPEGQLFRVLHKCLQRMQECVIVVDAVDECDDWNNLLQIATRLLDTKACVFKFFFSSQKVMGIPYVISRLPVTNKYRIDVTADEMQADISRYVEWRTRTLDLRSLGPPEHARDALIKGCDGLFLLVRLRLDILTRDILPLGTDIKTALSELPEDLFPLYERLLNRLDDKHKALAQLLFIWVIHAQRVLTVSELAEALRHELGPTEAADLPCLTESEIEGLSGGLIEISDGRVRLAHTTVRHFAAVYDWGPLAKVQDLGVQAMNERLLSRCLNYITTPALVSAITSSFELTSQIQDDWPLADYAQRSWFDHLQLCSCDNVELSRQVSGFINSDASLAWWMCYTTQLEMHNWWSIPEISADLTIWLRTNCKAYIAEEDAADIVYQLCRRHLEVMKAEKTPPRVDLYVPTLLRLASQKVEYGFPQESEQYLQEAIDLARDKTMANSTLLKIQALLDQSELMRILGRHDDARLIARELEKEIAEAEGDYDRQSIAIELNNAATALECREIGEAEQILRPLTDKARTLLDRNDPDTLSVIHTLATACYEHGNYVEAGTLWDVRQFKAVLGKTHPSTLSVMECVSNLYAAQGKVTEARKLRQESVMLRQARQSNKTIGMVRGELGLAYCQHNEKNSATALSMATRLLDRASGMWPDDHYVILEIKIGLSEFSKACEKYADAEKLERFVLQMRERTQGSRHAWTLQEKTRLAATLTAQNKYSAAVELLTDVVTIRREYYKTDSFGLHHALEQLSRVRRYMGQYQESLDLCLENLKAARALGGEDNTLALTSLAGVALAKEQLGERDEAERINRELLANWERISGAKGPNTLVSMINLAATLRNNGKCQEAEELGQRVLDIRMELLGEHHPDVLSAMSGLAISKRVLGKLAEAEALEQKVYDVRSTVIGGKLETLSAMGSLALTKRRAKKLKEAEELERAVVKGRQEAMGTDEHPDVATAMANLGITLMELNKLEEAEKLEEKVLEIRKKLSPTGGDTLLAMANLAITKRKLGKLEEAEALEERVCERRREQQATDPSALLDAMGSLAITQTQLGKYEAAEKLEEEVFAARKMHEGDDSNRTLIAMGNLAFTKSKLGRFQEAEEMQEYILEARRKNADEENASEVLTAMGNLASTKLELGKFDEAVELQLHVVKVHEERNGMTNPTIDAMSRLASIYLMQYRHEEAEELCRRIYDARLEEFGPDHDLVADAKLWLADCYDVQGLGEESHILYKEVLEARERVYGRDHAYTINIMEAVAMSDLDGGMLEMMEEVLEWRRNKLGPEHPDTIKAMHKLGMNLMVLQRFEEARALQIVALASREARVGPRHMDTLDTKEMLALNYCLDGQPEIGREIFLEVLEVMEDFFGPEHPRTIAVADALSRV
ncbi:hypothetical protein jhhlp_004962 [Lomentospora prolificans]|uniref:Uncharacterized protein n=1 Tax=Lomentospora prolificans TaxID=41688 RepID=A0A2N3N802_9PEZI|nr:hypothetical protein jhhlp_004962 [Lomentospora prolificans]